MADEAEPTLAEVPQETGEGDAVAPPDGPPEGEEGALEKVANEEIGGEGWVAGDIGGEYLEGEYMEGEMEGEEVEGEETEAGEKEKVVGEGDEMMGEYGGEQMEGEQEDEGKEDAKVEEEMIEEEEIYEEAPVDPAAPYDFTDSKEALKAPFSLRPDQLAEVEYLWELYQNYTPAYADLDGYVTETELIYLLKCLLIMTFTPEQLQELITYCVRPPHPDGHINFDQFVKMVTLRQRDFPIEEELRCSLEVMDPEKTGLVDREYLKEVVGKLGHKMPQKQLDNFIKEVDMSNDGTIGIEDVVGTLCIDLNRDDIVMLMNQLNPPEEQNDKIDDLV